MESDMPRIYIFAGESYMIRRSLNRLKQSLAIPYEQMNMTEYKDMPGSDELIEACAAVPFMAQTRFIAVRDCSVLTTKGSAAEAKIIAESLGKLPDSTVLALCTGTLDKRRSLYKRVKELGEVKEFPFPKQAACIDFVMEQAKHQGAAISRRTAEMLVTTAGCDYYTLEHETDKLAVVSGFKEILPAHVAACASRSLEYNIFEIHGLFISKKAKEAKDLLDDIIKQERPEALIGLFARKIRDMYKVRAMMDAGFPQTKIASMLGVKSFIAEKLARECSRFSGDALRFALKQLADLDFGIKSGEKDPALALPHTLIQIYGL